MNEINTDEILLGRGTSSPWGDRVMRKTLWFLNQIDSLHYLAVKYLHQPFLISLYHRIHLVVKGAVWLINSHVP